MANALDQTKNLFSVDDYNKDDISDKSKIIKALDNPAFGEFRSKEDIIDKAKKTGTGLLTGTLAIPSDILSGAEMVNTALADYANSPTAMVLKNAFKEASDKYGRPAFDKWFSTTTGLESNPENVDQLVGEVLSPTGTLLSGAKLLNPVGKVGKQIVKDTKAFFDDMSGGDGGALATANNAPIQAIDETSKLLDKTKVTKPIETNIPALPSASELANKPIINPTIVGTQTETGRKAEAIYDDLVAKGVTDPKEIFKKTGGGYVGSDGKFRFDLDDRDAVFKKEPDNIEFDVDSDGNKLQTKTILLNNILKYDQLYKEYFQKINLGGKDYSALKNIKVVLDYADTGDNTLGFYRSADDSIHLNMQNLIDPRRNKQEQTDYNMATLIHEVQHAVQRREGFYGGSNTDDTKELILKNIDEEGVHTLPLGRGKKEISLPYISGISNYSTDSAYSAYLEADILSRAINNNTNTDKFISLADNIADDITNFTGDRKIEFLRNYEILLDSKNRLKGEMERYKTRIKKIANDLNISEAEAASLRNESSGAFAEIATEIFPANFNKAKSAFGFKDRNTFGNFVFQDLKSIEDLKGFVDRAYNRARVNINLNDKDLAKIEAEQARRLKNDEQLLQFKKEVDVESNKLYREEYGEMEARLVEQRYARRQELRRDPMLFTDEQITEKMLDETGAIFKEPDVYGRTNKILGGFKKSQQLNINSNTPSSSINASVQKLESTNVKPDSPALQKISKIAKLQDGPLGSRTKLDKDGLPENLLRDKDGKPLILYYGDKGYEFKRGADKKEVIKTPINEPAKLKNKFKGANFLTYGDSSGLPTNATYVTPNPMFASTYAMGSDRGSVIPIYVIADKVTDIGNKNFMAIDKAGAKADRGEVIIGNAGQDYNFQKEISQEMANAADKKYGTQQYVFKDGVQVFSALTGERLTNLPTINQNIRNKLLKLNQAEEDTLLKKMSPKEKLQYKAKKSYIEDLDDEYFIEDMFKLDRKSDIVRNEKKRNLAKGGVTMDNQMEMFQDGGLKDEGGTIDPVSGNDVPSGSTQEEVRDDIPAQLSEGEFVFPADVVRFIGLEKLMMMRQEAKAGLKRMEEMGQMGNSDEATIPDDTPFDINDLDMEDDDTVEMAQGGVIQAANGTFVNTAPNVMYNPSQFAGQNLPSQQNNPNAQPISYNAPVYNPVPAGSYTPTYYNQLNQGNDNVASFENLVGSNYGQYDEMRKYTSESGLVLNIPFKGGQPIYPIPEGYTYVDPEATKTEEVKTVTPTPQTTQVTQQQDDGGDDPDGGGGAVDLVGDPLSYKSVFNPDALDKTLRGYAGMQVGLFNMRDALSRGFKDQVNVNEITLNAARETLKSIKSGLPNPNINLGTLDTDQRNGINEQLERINNSIKTLVTDTNYDSDGKAISSTPVTLETLETRAKGLETQARIAGVDMKNFNARYPAVKKPSVTTRNPMAMRNYTKTLALRAATIQMALQMESQQRMDKFNLAADSASDKDTLDTLQQAQDDVAAFNKANPSTAYGVPDISPTDSNDSDDNPGMGGGDSGDTSGYTDDTGLGVGAKGGFFTKSKMTKQKPKKMKRGGLASR